MGVRRANVAAPRRSMIMGVSLSSLAGAASLAGAGAPGNPGAIIRVAPPEQVVVVGELVEVSLLVSSAGRTPQPFDAVDAILAWDPGVLGAIGVSVTHADVSYVLAGFLPDPDGVNTDLADGDAIFTGLVPPLLGASAPPAPESLLLATFTFPATSPTIGTEVSLLPVIGAFGETRVLSMGGDVTASLGEPVVVTIAVSGACIDADHDCFTTGGAGCADLSCCNGVCGEDPACCDLGWDATCVGLAETLCIVVDPCEAGDGCCFSEHPGAGCNRSPCCSTVCDVAPSCCTVTWDESCATLAGIVCCPGDLDGNGVVDGADLGMLLAEWNRANSPADLDCTGAVDGADLGALLAHWGSCAH